MKVKIEFLDRKKIPTWKVSRGKDEWFFNETNGSVFDHPKDRAERLYSTLLKGEKDGS